MNSIDKGIKQFYTSTFFNPDSNKLPNNYSIARSQPKGYSYPSLDMLAPSKELLSNYKYNNLSWDDYIKEYNTQLDSNKKAILDMINGLENNSVLNCWEPIENPQCHRHLLSKWLRTNGINIKEYGHGIPIIYDDILSTTDPYVLQQVNNRGVMGAGLAKQIKEDLSIEDFNRYKDYVLANRVNSLGTVLPLRSSTVPDRTYMNIVGQDGYGTDRQYTDYAALQKGLNRIADRLPIGSNVSIPYGMGAGLGGGD